MNEPNSHQLKVINQLKKLHIEFQVKNNKGKILNYSEVKKINPKLSSAIDRTSMSWIELLIASNLNPICHISQFKYGKTNQERKKTFALIIEQFIEDFGVESLSDTLMNTKQSLNIPSALLPKVENSLCVNLGCPKFNLTRRSVYAQGRRLFGTWEDALQSCDIDYQNDVLRRVSALDIDDIIRDLDTFDRLHNGKWFITDIRDENPRLDKAIRNSKNNKIRQLPLVNLNSDSFLSAYACLCFFRETADFMPTNDWWLKNKEEVIRDFNENHRAQKQWSKGQILDGLHQIYSRGTDEIRLLRSSVQKSKNDDDHALWSAVRQKRFRDKNITESDWLKEAGFLPEELNRLYQDLDEKYTLKETAKKFAYLMELSLKNNQNCLTREYCSQYEPEFCNFIICKYKSWEQGLRRFGLDPIFFAISSSKRTKRGYQFQEFFRQLLIQENFEEVDKLSNNKQFISNKSISECTHSIKCKPDFRFLDKIIDTKTGYHASQKPDQMLRYKDHSDRVVILTLKDKYHKVIVENLEIEVIGFAEFLQHSKDFLGIELDANDYNKRLSTVLKRKPFWK